MHPAVELWAFVSLWFGQATLPGVPLAETPPEIDFVVYPLPDYEGNPWSHWGQGLIASNGRHYSAFGDHLGVDGNAYLCEYDPETGEMRIVGTAQEAAGHVPGHYGFGKIHSQINEGPDGALYMTTYRGSSRGREFSAHYRGDVILRYDPESGELEGLGVAVDEHNVPSTNMWTEGGLLYGEAVASDERVGPIFVYDVNRREVIFTGGAEMHGGFRNIMVAADGSAYFSDGGSGLIRYDPARNELERTGIELPGGGWLRASTRPAPPSPQPSPPAGGRGQGEGAAREGTIYGATHQPPRFFALEPESGRVRDLGEAPGYVASMALSPDGRYFYYVPGAHGNGPEWGTALVQFDTATGRQKVIAYLNEYTEREHGYTVGGSYSIATDGERVFVQMNGCPVESPTRGNFGEVLLLVVHVPESER